MSELPAAEPGKPLFVRRNGDGTCAYFQEAPSAQLSAVVSKPNLVANTLVFYINGKKHVVEDLDPRTTLSDYLRSCFGLTGTKKMCGEVSSSPLFGS